MEEKEKRIIVIGSEGHYGVETVPWTAEEMPNIADYENVIVDTSSLTPFLVKVERGKNLDERYADFLRKIRKNQEFVRERLIHLLHSGGNICSICSTQEYRAIGTYSGITNYDWSPFPIKLVKEKGETIELYDDSFKRYFESVKKWHFCFEEMQRDYAAMRTIHDFYKGEYYIRPRMRVIAENRYTRPIAIALKYEIFQFQNVQQLHEATTSMDAIKRYGAKLVGTSGELILLSPPTEIDSGEVINLLLNEFWGIQQKTLPPEGIDKIVVPGEDVLKQEIQNKVDNIEELKSEIGELEIRKKEVVQFKQLLYETGPPLENICKITLRKLGCDVDDSVEDFILTKGDKEAIVEVKGREGVIERKDGAQLSQNRRNYAISKGKALTSFKAILLGNPRRLLLPLEERIKKESFAQHLIGDAKVEDMALVTTVQLFKAYREFLEGKISSEEIIEQLFSGIGQTKLV